MATDTPPPDAEPSASSESLTLHEQAARLADLGFGSLLENLDFDLLEAELIADLQFGWD